MSLENKRQFVAFLDYEKKRILGSINDYCYGELAVCSLAVTIAIRQYVLGRGRRTLRTGK